VPLCRLLAPPPAGGGRLALLELRATGVRGVRLRGPLAALPQQAPRCAQAGPACLLTGRAAAPSPQSRPFGVALLIAGWDDKGPVL
jgi:hypothetical protein